MIAVVGCGNLNRQDDGAGPEVIRALRAGGLEGHDVKLLDAGTDGMAVMFAARGCTSLVLVDAARTGVEPGAIYEVPGHELARPYTPGLNLHDFRWDAALHAGRKIFGAAFPEDVTVFLIEAKQLDLGIGLSPNVAAATLSVARRIERIVAERRTDRPG
ncbi:hydrogenase maturation protease [Mesorhizobium sp. VK25A]|uniref:Hydrogenase maturation protease n=1 Tax=Mesorhizobium vachelliae TaxID=3072309 RepID=A0ABU5AA79_9HYPH|nr:MULTISPECIES: hydrogenase maturation protease [unclassified Mesorhizobium]MDX8533111.1 hydrogenase maturation protease [Mesorhizobium sp. VK25D]MDX8545030.1 hydrogenase maturation protease [Mesorhizobium sp. VK25A]